MKICTTIDEIICLLKDYRTKNIKTGMVPTMGALHAGHISLVEKSVSENDITIVSIFVNPIQFNNPKDLKNYPRTLEKDLEMLDKTKCDIIFSPNAKEMYPEKDNIQFNFGDLGSVMEGKFRPGHFNGVAIIVKKLFDIVKPDSAYFGKKDFQQLAIIKALVKEIKSPVRIVSCKTIREDDGLAMSSRNTLLSQEQRKKAPMIYKILVFAREMIKKHSVEYVKNFVSGEINKNSFFRLEYFEIVDSESLKPVNSWTDSANLTGCIAVYMDNVRLIDNIEF